jgi:hypothetical protein
MKISKRQLRRVIREEYARLKKHGLIKENLDNLPAVETMEEYVNMHIDDFIDLYIRSSSSPERFWDRWEYHCEENGIPYSQDELEALVIRAEEMGEVEQGELFVGERGAW